ncbi:MAG: hypothetical protein NTV86_16570, partial [Planctomycetota bacterium]|nr:hypothetical protein [Planctomycetota bacterium]
MTGLKFLTLTGARVSDAGLRHLERMPRLKYLKVDGTRVTEAGLNALREKCPNIGSASEVIRKEDRATTKSATRPATGPVAERIPARIGPSGGPSAKEREEARKAFQTRIGSATIRLAGVGGEIEGRPTWWLPNGEPLAGRPAGWPEKVRLVPGDRSFGVAVEGLGADEPMQVRVAPCGSGVSRNVARSGAAEFDVISVKIPKGVPRVVVDVGVELGAWELFVQGAPGTHVMDAGGNDVAIGAVTPSGLEVPCQCQLSQEWSVRMTIIKSDGTTTPPVGVAREYQREGATLVSARLPQGLPAEGVSQVRIERRRVQWVRFGDVRPSPGAGGDFAPARPLAAEWAGIAPLPDGVAPVDPARLTAREAEVAGVAQRVMTALQAGEIDAVKALSLGSVIGWYS